MRTVASAKNKLILFGEHAAVYGYPSVGLALPWKISVTLTPADNTTWNLPSLPQRHKIKLNLLLQKLPQVFPEISKVPPFEISLTTEAPLGVGFGSSGALSVALARTIFKYCGLSLPEKEVWLRAHELEKCFHNTPSGIDTALSVFETFCYFEGKEGQLPKPHFISFPKIPLIIGALERASNTGSLIAGLREKKKRQPQISNHIEALGNFAKEAVEIMQKSSKEDISHIGELATEAHRTLANLGLSNHSLDTMINYGISCGATGGKLSGAGGGGAYFLIAKDLSQAKQIAKKLSFFAKENGISHALSPVAICK